MNTDHCPICLVLHHMERVPRNVFDRWTQCIRDSESAAETSIVTSLQGELDAHSAAALTLEKEKGTQQILYLYLYFYQINTQIQIQIQIHCNFVTGRTQSSSSPGVAMDNRFWFIIYKMFKTLNRAKKPFNSIFKHLIRSFKVNYSFKL